MLQGIFTNQLALGCAQAAATTVLALLVMLLARQREIHLERETVVALMRGLVQIIAVGSIFLLLLRGPAWTSVVLLAAMMVAAAVTSTQRAQGIPGTFRVSLYAIAAGSGAVIALMTWAGVIDTAMTSLVPIGSMLISNAMNTNSLTLNRFRSEVESHFGLIETALALGAASQQTVAPYVQVSFQASLIPAIDSLKSLARLYPFAKQMASIKDLGRCQSRGFCNVSENSRHAKSIFVDNQQVIPQGFCTLPQWIKSS